MPTPLSRFRNRWARRIRAVRYREARLSVGDRITPQELVTVTGRRVAIPDATDLVHLQFRRYAGCPICNMHLRSIIAHRNDISTAGIREVIVFHASPDEVRRYEQELPLDVVADPQRLMYNGFGVERSIRAFAAPLTYAKAAWLAILAYARRERRVIRLLPEGGRRGLPADFLIAPGGRIVALKYGEHAGDQWSVEEILTLARQHTLSRPR